MTKSLVSAMALAALAGMANAQSVEFRIVERSAANQGAAPLVGVGTDLNAGNAVGNYAVQARVVAGANGSALGGFSFDIVIPGEPDTNGSVTRLRISNADGTYFTGAAGANQTVGTGGLAKQFTYLAGINAAFNGQLNTSSGTFTNQPGQQEIGLITASATGTALLGTPGLDPDGEGNPSTWSGYGSGGAPASGNTASLPGALAGPFFGAGEFIDVYRFRYTTTNFTGRVLTMTLANAAAQVFNQFLFNNGSWGPQATTVGTGSVTTSGLQVTVTPAPASAALIGLGGLVAARRRRSLVK